MNANREDFYSEVSYQVSALYTLNVCFTWGTPFIAYISEHRFVFLFCFSIYVFYFWFWFSFSSMCYTDVCNVLAINVQSCLMPNKIYVMLYVMLCYMICYMLSINSHNPWQYSFLAFFRLCNRSVFSECSMPNMHN